MNTDVVRQVEPDISCTELDLEIPKPFRMLGREVDGPSRHELQGKSNAPLRQLRVAS